MIYLFIVCIAESVALIITSYLCFKERETLVKLLASKDYNEYVSFEERPKEHKKRTNMFEKRDQKEKQFVEENN